MRFGMEFASALMLRSRVFRDSRTDLISLRRLIRIDRIRPVELPEWTVRIGSGVRIGSANE
ncbi:hypothetical protein RRSWK_03914 [Rhodopirellula sp. SWK7]|nr:hypothetical protein RRSWK_03914 [Rhodopirellula sp. SWK7]